MLEAVGFGLLFILGTIGIAWIAYFGMRALAAPKIEGETRDLAGSVIFRVAALHGLILALVFAQEMLDYQQIRSSLVEEATAIADVYHDIRRYGADIETETKMLDALSRYVRLIVDTEWEQLASEEMLTVEGWELREIVYVAILDLIPATSRQQDLRSHMLEKIQSIAEFRQKRENMAVHGISGLFWFAAFAGVVLVSMPYFVFAPNTLNLILLSMYGAFTGIAMLMIFAFSDPFSHPGRLSPVAFERLLDSEVVTDG